MLARIQSSGCQDLGYDISLLSNSYSSSAASLGLYVTKQHLGSFLHAITSSKPSHITILHDI